MKTELEIKIAEKINLEINKQFSDKNQNIIFHFSDIFKDFPTETKKTVLALFFKELKTLQGECHIGFDFKKQSKEEPLTFEELEVIAAALTESKNLILLDLSGQKIALKDETEDDTEQQKDKTTLLCNSLKNIPTLKTFILVNNQLGDKEAKIIGTLLENNNTLETLDLLRNNISNEGAVAICQNLKDNKTLKILDLGSNQINTSGSLEIKKILGEKTLKISLDGNDIEEINTIPILEPKNDMVLDNINLEENIPVVTSELAHVPIQGVWNKIKPYYDNVLHDGIIAFTDLLDKDRLEILQYFDEYIQRKKLEIPRPDEEIGNLITRGNILRANLNSPYTGPRELAWVSIWDSKQSPEESTAPYCNELQDAKIKFKKLTFEEQQELLRCFDFFIQIRKDIKIYKELKLKELKSTDTYDIKNLSKQIDLLADDVCFLEIRRRTLFKMCKKNKGAEITDPSKQELLEKLWLYTQDTESAKIAFKELLFEEQQEVLKYCDLLHNILEKTDPTSSKMSVLTKVIKELKSIHQQLYTEINRQINTRFWGVVKDLSESGRKNSNPPLPDIKSPRKDSNPLLPDLKSPRTGNIKN